MLFLTCEYDFHVYKKLGIIFNDRTTCLKHVENYAT